MVSFLGLLDQNFNISVFGYFSLTLIIVILVYMVYQYRFNNNHHQRFWIHPKLPTNQEFQVFTADSVGDRDQMFSVGTKQDDVVKKQAYKFFQEQYGLGDSFLSTYMYQVSINPNLGYHLQYSQAVPGYQGKIQDSGYACYIPEGYKLYGHYGGNGGVTIDRSGIIAYGHYLIGDKFKIRYWSICPVKTYSSFDGDYTPIDYDVEIEQAPEGRLIGLKGKARGMYIKMKLIPDQTKPLEKDHLVIRNVLTFM